MSQYENNISGKLLALSDIKANIKRALGTESDDFSTYPTLIEEAMSAGAGGGSPYDDAIGVADMIMNGDTTADYVSSTIMSNFWTDGSGSEWNETVTIDTGEVDGNDEPIMEEKTVHFDIATGGSDIATALEDYPNLYGNIYPIIQNVTLVDPSTIDPNFDPQVAGHDYEASGELYFWNLNDMSVPVVEITENGFYPSASDVTLGYEVNVPSGGLSEGTYNIFNFLAYGMNNGKIVTYNKAYEEINLYNLGPVNYIDPMDGMETKNQKVEMNLWDNPQMDTEVEFENVTGDATSNGSDHWYQFNELSQSSEADEFMVVHIDVYDWQSDIDPDTGMDAGSWEVLDTYVAAFENAYEIDRSGAWTYTIRFYYNNNEWVVDLYQNGILVEEGVSAFAQQ